MQYRHSTVSGMLDNIKAIALNAMCQKLRPLSWSPSHSLTLQQQLDLCACLSSPLEWMMHPCAHVSVFVSHLFLQYGLDSGQRGQTVCRGGGVGKWRSTLAQRKSGTRRDGSGHGSNGGGQAGFWLERKIAIYKTRAVKVTLMTNLITNCCLCFLRWLVIAKLTHV